MTDDLPSLDVFYGDLTANRAIVYARLPRPPDGAGLSLVGTIRGPRCLHAETLPATSPLVDLGPGPTLLAQALVPEPCFWSPDLPAIYDVTINLRRGSDIIATARREIGLRSFGVRGRHMILDGKRWVLRGVLDGSTTAALPRQWQAAAVACVTESTDHERLSEASQWGALTAVVVVGNAADIAARLRQLALYPAVAIAIVQGRLPPDSNPTSIAPNLLFAQPFSFQEEFAVQAWANLLYAETDNFNAMKSLAAATDLPLLAVRRLASPAPLDSARAACDTLQRDLAPLGQFAGYIV
jgi:hypothetical protein